MSRYSTEPHTPLARLVVAACVSPSRAARYATDRWLPKALRAVTILGLAALIGLTACQKRQEPGVADGGGTEPKLSVLVKGSTQSIGRAELLKRRDVEAIEIADDVSYHRRTRYFAIPVTGLLPRASGFAGAVLKVKALDGFVAEIPWTLIGDPAASGPHAYLAVEQSRHPWPNLPGKSRSAGPFYLIWSGPGSASISSEYWPFQIASMSLAQDSIDLPAAGSIEQPALKKAVDRGRGLLEANCSSCHRVDGQGEGGLGPDLDRPANPTRYFQRHALHQYIRDPASIRSWPGRQMTGFDKKRLSDRDIDDIIDYLAALQARRTGS